MTSGDPAPDLRHRSTVDLLVLTLTVTVCSALLLIGAGILLVKVRDPAADVSAAAQALFGAVSLILGALLGMLPGRPARRRR